MVKESGDPQNEKALDVQSILFNASSQCYYHGRQNIIHEHAMSVHIPRLCYQSMLLVNAIINNDCYPRSVLALISDVSTDGDTNSNFGGSFYRVCALL